MAITLEASYTKKVGLPNYSSHQFSVTVRAELSDLSQVEEESARLYRLLQDSVDREIQQPGFLPTAANHGGNGNGNGAGNNGHGDGQGTNGQRRAFSDWRCTEGQKGFILRLSTENNLDKNEIEGMAQQLFGAGVKELDKMQASQLIEEILEKTGKKGNGSRGGHYRRQEVRK